MSQCLPLNGASVLQPSVYKAAILPWTMTHTGKSRRIRQELCSSWGLLKMRIQSHKFLEKLSLSFPLTALIVKICCCWYTFTNSRLAANCLCQWASHIHCLPLSPSHCDQLFLTPFSSKGVTSDSSISYILLSPHRLFSPVLFLIFPGYSTPLPTAVGEWEKIELLLLTPCKLHLDLELPKNSVKAVGTIWGRDLHWYQKFTTISASNI